MNIITPEAFVAWLTTQLNSRGTLYLERVAYQYARYLRTAPHKLDLLLSANERNVYIRRTPAEFNSLVQTFISAPNYKAVNANGHQTFSAALKCFARYLDFLLKCDNHHLAQNSAVFAQGGLFVAQTNTVVVKPMDKAVSYVDFANTSACSGSNPVSCIICGAKIPFVGNWRDLLVSITEFCVSEYPEKTEKLKKEWFSNYNNTPYLLSEKPALSGKKISTGYWINVHYSISQLITIIAGLLRYCGINLSNVEITYMPKSVEEKIESFSVSSNNIISSVVVPESILDVLRTDYANGFRFDNTALRLLTSKSGVELDDALKSALKQQMFCRKDGVYFLLDVVADEETRKEIIDFSDALLDEYGCFETSELYAMYVDKLNPKCIDGTDGFEKFYEHIGNRGVRIVAAPQIGNRIARFSNGNVWGIFNEVATKIVAVITEDYYGSCNEDDLHTNFFVFSTDLLGKIIKNCASDELIRVEINDSVCYQTFDALGLPENFSEALKETLALLSDVGLEPTQDVLHTAISLKLGVNFKTEFNLPDWDTYRRLIAAFYKAEPHREWRSNIFGEISN